jgi:superfamily I DNA/RNA helicase
MTLNWNPPQTEALVQSQSILLIGPAGSGKTVVLLEKALRLASSGQRVVLTTFASRVMEHLKQQGQPSLTPHIATGQLKATTLYELAASQLAQNGMSLQFASNNQVRALLRQLCAEHGFTGTVEEAEHIIRAAKGRAKKLPEADRHYSFVKAYQALLDQLGLSDRHDVVRRHVLGMKDGTVPPLATDWLLLDGLQDATELQLIWLQMHLAKGVKLLLTADDDVTAFGRDGALGPLAIQQVQGWAEQYDFEVLELPASYRLAPTLMAALNKQARLLRTRIPKAELSRTENPAPQAGQLPLARYQGFSSQPSLHAGLLDIAQSQLRLGKRVGFITRDDFSAAVLTHVLQAGGINPASFARLIWENPTPQIVLASLHTLLNQATPAHLSVLLLGLGVPAEVVVRAQNSGALNAPEWLQQGAPIPLEPHDSPTTQARVTQIRWALRAAHALWVSRTLPPPAVFKALWADLLPLLPEAEQPAALLALESLLRLQGKLAEVLPRVLNETMPDMASPITVAPVREVRNHQFDVAVVVDATEGRWPKPASPILGIDHDHERRLWLLACSRAKESLVLTAMGEPGPLTRELAQQLGLKIN